MRRIAVGLVVVTLVGCGAASVTVLKPYPAKPDDCEIEVLASAPQVRPYEELCILNARTGSTMLSDTRAAALIDDLKRDACRCGADAIIIRYTKDGSTNMFRFDEGRASAVAIRYTD